MPTSWASATVLIPDDPVVAVDGSVLQLDDRIVALGPDGACVGEVLWRGTNTPLTLWADDPSTRQPDGLTEGDPVSFRVYRKGSPSAALTFTFQPSLSPDGGFRLDEVYIVTPATRTPPRDRSAAPRNMLAPIRPNPVVQKAQLSLSLDVAEHVQVDILDVLGRRVAIVFNGPLSVGDHVLPLDASELPAGTYVCWVRSGRRVFQRRFTVAR